MTSFRRSTLRGSEELFRPTHPDSGSAAELRPDAAAPPVLSGPGPVPAAVRPQPAGPTAVRPHEGRLLRLSDDDLETLAESLQALKFPSQQRSRPSVEDFERLEELRKRLLAALG